MKSTPDEDQVRAIADALGFRMTADELAVARRAIAAMQPAVELAERYEAHAERPPTFPGDRSSQRRSTEQEDPYRTFITRCDVAGSPDGPLAGVTLGVKDAIAMSGLPLTQGCRAFEGVVPDFDATVVHRALDAGMTIVGKANMEPLSMGVSSAGSRDYGVVRNPWDPARSPGGSSSGSGAAIAAGLADVTLGTDSGGSVRVPAAWCGAVGLKPTHGVLPMTGVGGFEPAHDHVGVISRDVALVARTMDALAGPDGYDRFQDQTPALDFAGGLDRGLGGVRIALLEEGMSSVLEPDIAEAVEAALGVLDAGGATVTRVSLPLHTDAMALAAPLLYDGMSFELASAFAGQPLYRYVSPSLAAAMGNAMRATGSRLPLMVRSSAILARFLHDRDHGALGARIVAMRPYVRRAYDELFASCDVLAMPTVPMKPPLFKPGATFEEAHLLAGSGGGEEFAVVAANTWAFNLTGHPAITVPCAVSEGLPVALQLVGRRFEDPLLLQVARAFQASVGWAELTIPPEAR